MAWIKRNLFFLIGSLIALALMVVGIFYLLGQINSENQVTEDIQKQYSILSDLAGRKPHPGNDKVDNIKTAREQDAALRDYLKRERATYQPIDSIPSASAGKISNADFVRELRNTIAQLRHSAEQQSVTLPPAYDFTFKSQQNAFIFSPGTLEPLASHLGEIKALCDVFFAAKINFLDNIQREIVSTNQDTNPSDYLQTKKTVSTPLADITPYQFTFRCFSAELAQVLASLATSPYGFLVESINIEPVNAGYAGYADDSSIMNAGAAPGAPPPNFPPAGFHGGRPGFAPPPGGAAPTATAPSGRPTAFLNEKPFRVTLLIQVIKPKAPAPAK